MPGRKSRERDPQPPKPRKITIPSDVLAAAQAESERRHELRDRIEQDLARLPGLLAHHARLKQSMRYYQDPVIDATTGCLGDLGDKKELHCALFYEWREIGLEIERIERDTRNTLDPSWPDGVRARDGETREQTLFRVLVEKHGASGSQVAALFNEQAQGRRGKWVDRMRQALLVELEAERLALLVSPNSVGGLLLMLHRHGGALAPRGWYPQKLAIVDDMLARLRK